MIPPSSTCRGVGEDVLLSLGHTKLIVSFSSPRASFFTLHPVFLSIKWGCGRSTAHAQCNQSATSNRSWKDLGTEDKGVDSGKVRCGLAEMGVV